MQCLIPRLVLVFAVVLVGGCDKEKSGPKKGKQQPTDTGTTPSVTETFECAEVTATGTNPVADLLQSYGCGWDAGIASGNDYTVVTDASVTAAEVVIECADCVPGGEVHPLESAAITDGLEWTVALRRTRLPGTYTGGRTTEWLGPCGPNKLTPNGATVVIRLTTADGAACQAMGCNAQAWADSEGCRAIP